MNNICKSCFASVYGITVGRRFVVKPQRIIRKHHQRFVDGREDSRRSQRPLKFHPLRAECQDAVHLKGFDFIIKILRVEGTVLDVRTVVINISRFVSNELGIFFKLFQPRFVERHVDINFTVQIGDDIFHFDNRINPLQRVKGVNTKSHGINVAHVDHKAIVNECAVARIKIKQAHIHLSVECEIPVLPE